MKCSRPYQDSDSRGGSIKWKMMLQSKLNSVMSTFISNKTFRNSMLNNSSMKVWTMAFTHESVDSRFNYENLEHLGDKICGGAFALYLATRYPDQNPIVYTSLNNMYMEKMFQGQVATQLGFNKLVRIFSNTIVITYSVVADTYESFVGALFLVGRELGMFLCYKFIDRIQTSTHILASGRSKDEVQSQEAKAAQSRTKALWQRHKG